MKIIVGIDGSGHEAAAFDLIARLKFFSPAIDLVNVVPSTAQIASTYVAAAAVNLDEIMRDIKTEGEESLEQAKDKACGRGLNCRTVLLEGHAAESLAEYASRQQAEVIAVAARPKGTIACLFAGSVARSLSIAAKESVLVARDSEAANPGPVTAVFATDHSEYANHCLDRLLAWKPVGLRRVIVVSAYDTVGRESAYLGGVAAVRSDEIDSFIASRVEAETEKVADRLREAGIAATSLVLRGSARDAIHAAMTANQADVLILGARGHGFWERLTLGSTALHQVVAEPYSILIVREPEPKK